MAQICSSRFGNFSLVFVTKLPSKQCRRGGSRDTDMGFPSSAS